MVALECGCMSWESCLYIYCIAKGVQDRNGRLQGLEE